MVLQSAPRKPCISLQIHSPSNNPKTRQEMNPFVKARPYYLKSAPDTQQGWEIDTAHGTFFCCITDQVRIYDEGRLIQMIPVGNMVRQFISEWPVISEVAPVLESVIRKRLIHFPLFDGQILDGECKCPRPRVKLRRYNQKNYCTNCSRENLTQGNNELMFK
jgi:hypothetical protein